MKKIKKFRIQPRPSAVARDWKAVTGRAPSADWEERLSGFLSRIKPDLVPAALFESFGAESAPEWARPLLSAPSESGAQPVAVTFFAVSLGEGLSRRLSEDVSAGDEGTLASCVGEEASRQAVNFVCRLIQDESKAESCETTPPVSADGVESARNVLALLDGPKIGVAVDDEGKIHPRFSRVGHVLWWPQSKKRR